MDENTQDQGVSPSENNVEKPKAAPIKKKNPKIKKMIIRLIIVLVVVFVGFKLFGNIKNKLFGKKSSETESVEAIDEGTPIKVYSVKRMDFKDTLPVLGVVKGYKEVPLKFQSSGVMESFNFEEGERIQEGDIIGNIEQKDALLKLKYAELEKSNSKKLFEIGGIIENAYEKAKLEYESAKSDLEKTNIYAMDDGVLGIQDIDVGTYVTPNDRIGLFVDTSKVYCQFNVIEKDITKLKLGQKTEIFVDALPKKTFVGTIDTISPIVEGRTRTQKIRIELKNRDGAIKPGMFIRGLISTYEKRNAIIIPASSLKKQEKEYVVYIVHRDELPEELDDEDEDIEEEGEELEDMPKDMGTIEIRPIKIGYMTQDKVEVSEGVEEGEILAIELYQDLQDKERVEIVEEQEILY